MFSSSFNNLDMANGASRIRPLQLGFPAELTSAWDADTGYSWKRLYISGVTVTNPTLQNVGDRAITPDNNTSLTSGTRGWMEPDAGAAGYIFHAIYEPPDGSASASECAWLAGAETTDCLLLTVVSATGRCSGISTTQEITLEWDAVDARWESTTDFTHTGAGSPGAVNFAFTTPNPPTLTIDGVSGLYQGCSNGKLYFAFGGTTLCGGTAGDCNNSFVVAITCTCCDLDGYTGPGWYVVADEGEVDCTGDLTVVELTGCDVVVIICDGPYDSEEEAENAAARVTVSCCTDPLPRTLTATFTDALADLGSVALVWNNVDAWEGTYDTACGAGTISFYCISGDSWTMTAPAIQSISSGLELSCTPFFSWIANGAGESPCTGSFNVSVTG